jgi:hypothetical protein
MTLEAVAWDGSADICRRRSSRTRPRLWGILAGLAAEGYSHSGSGRPERRASGSAEKHRAGAGQISRSSHATVKAAMAGGRRQQRRDLRISGGACLTLVKWETVSGRFGGYLMVRLVSHHVVQPSLPQHGVHVQEYGASIRPRQFHAHRARAFRSVFLVLAICFCACAMLASEQFRLAPETCHRVA